MTLPVQVVGIGAGGVESLSATGRQALASATFVAGGRRHLALAAPEGMETFTITNNLAELAERLRGRGPSERCVVLATGDPLCFGVGVFLRSELGPGELAVEPSVSSMQLAFARARIPWTDASLASVHGRPVASTLIPLLGRPTIGLFTLDGSSPSSVAEFFLARGLDDYTAWIGEDLGSVTERVTELAIRDLPGRRFSDLNFLVLARGGGEAGSSLESLRRDAIPPDDRFARPPSGPVLLSHAEVRAVALGQFHDVPRGSAWDIGAGLGGIAVGLAHRFPDAEVLAVEQSPDRLPYLVENRRRFGAWNLRIVEGTAPEVLEKEEAPAAVFLGGSAGHLEGILELVLGRLCPEGVLVANFVGLEHLSLTLERLRAEGWQPGVTQVQVSRGLDLGGLTTFKPERPVWVVRAVRPSPRTP